MCWLPVQSMDPVETMFLIFWGNIFLSKSSSLFISSSYFRLFNFLSLFHHHFTLTSYLVISTLITVSSCSAFHFLFILFLSNLQFHVYWTTDSHSSGHQISFNSDQVWKEEERKKLLSLSINKSLSLSQLDQSPNQCQ